MSFLSIVDTWWVAGAVLAAVLATATRAVRARRRRQDQRAQSLVVTDGDRLRLAERLRNIERELAFRGKES
jgi:hypothetical protein